MPSPSFDNSASNRTESAPSADVQAGQDQAISPARLVSRDLVVVGASAGGVEALSELVRDLPDDLPASVFVVLHVPRHGTSVLPTILSRRGRLPARVPDDGEAIERGMIYVAPPDLHMVLENGRVYLTRGPSENGHRPAIDPLFRSAAKIGGQRVIGVILSGMLDDGTAGLSVIKRHGGTALVQEPSDALFAGMPSSALMNVHVDYSIPLRDMGGLILRLASTPVPLVSALSFADSAAADSSHGSSGVSSTNASAGTTKEPLRMDSTTNAITPGAAAAQANSEEMQALRDEVGAALMEPGLLDREVQPGAVPSVYACPECAGVLWEVKNEGLMRFRCRTGHAYSADSLLAAQSDALEAALWTALRALEESASLSLRLYLRAKERGHHLAEVRFLEQARESTERAGVVRQVLVTGKARPAESGDTNSGGEKIIGGLSAAAEQGTI